MATATRLPPSPFLSALNRSGLVPKEELDQFLRENDPNFQARNAPTKIAWVLVRKKVLTPYQVMQLRAGKTQGFKLGSYTVLEGIRQDRVGRVFLAEDTKSRKQVAVKILPTDRVADNTILSAFVEEVRLA